MARFHPSERDGHRTLLSPRDDVTATGHSLLPQCYRAEYCLIWFPLAHGGAPGVGAFARTRLGVLGARSLATAPTGGLRAEDGIPAVAERRFANC